MVSERSILLAQLVTATTLLAFVVSPVVLVVVFATRSWRTLANPWGYIAVSFVVLYGLALTLAYLAFPIGVGIAGVRPGTPPPGFLERHALEIRIYGSLIALIALSIVFLRYLRMFWSK